MEFFDEGCCKGVFSYIEEEDCISIWSVGIFPEFRERGLGTKMMKEALQFFEEMGASRLVLFVDCFNDAAQKLYRRVGFVFLPPSDDRIYTYKMEKIL
jgi:ribosomal protein S18 acetylase RimI-like enzyme